MPPLYKGKVRTLPQGYECVQQIPGDWIIARIKSNHEKTVVRALDATGERFFFPYEKIKRVYEDRIRIVNRPILPGYVFVQESAKDLLDHGIFADHMGARHHRYKQVAAEDRPRFVRELANLQIMADVAENDPNARLNAIFHPLRTRGTRVQVIAGPYIGLDGEVVKWDGEKTRVQVSVIVLGVATEVPIPEDYLTEV